MYVVNARLGQAFTDNASQAFDEDNLTELSRRRGCHALRNGRLGQRTEILEWLLCVWIHHDPGKTSLLVPIW